MRRMLLGGFAAALMLQVGQAQERPAAHVVPAGKTRDIAKWPATQQEAYRSARLGMEWLKRTNRPDGRFVYGFLPALCVPLDGDSYIGQGGAAYALGHAARYFGDEGATAVARQALLTLLLETAVDPQSPHERCTAAPPQMLNRLASSGALLLAIHELATPGKDLLDQGDQLASFVKRQLRSDGILAGDAGDVGLALHGISHSQKHRPAPWKLDLLRKACAQAQAQWRSGRSLPLVVSHTPALAEAYLTTREAAFAETVFAWNDWLVTLQHTQTEPLRKHWDGGFPPWEQDRPQASAPDIRSALCAESLAQACRVARAANDLGRYQRYGRALEQALRFLLTLRYSSARTRHFVDEFRPAVLGAFHASAQDGNLRLDYTEHALTALLTYLEHLVE